MPTKLHPAYGFRGHPYQWALDEDHPLAGACKALYLPGPWGFVDLARGRADLLVDPSGSSLGLTTEASQWHGPQLAMDFDGVDIVEAEYLSPDIDWSASHSGFLDVGNLAAQGTLLAKRDGSSVDFQLYTSGGSLNIAIRVGNTFKSFDGATIENEGSICFAYRRPGTEDFTAYYVLPSTQALEIGSTSALVGTPSGGDSVPFSLGGHSGHASPGFQTTDNIFAAGLFEGDIGEEWAEFLAHGAWVEMLYKPGLRTFFVPAAGVGQAVGRGLTHSLKLERPRLVA